MAGAIINEILDSLQELIPNVERIQVDRIVVGLGYTAAHLTTGQVGVCFSFQAEITPRSWQAHKRAENLAGTSAIELAKMAKSWDLSKGVIGLATMNALSSIAIETNRASYCLSRGNVLEDIEFRKDDVVVMVGNIVPLRKGITRRVKKVYVLERDLSRREHGVLPDTANEEIVPKANVAIITGTSLANGTIDRLLELSRDAREIAVVGASASVLPSPLFNHGATIVGSIRVLDANKLLQIVAEGGGTRQLKEAVEFVNIRPRNQHTHSDKQKTLRKLRSE